MRGAYISVISFFAYFRSANLAHVCRTDVLAGITLSRTPRLVFKRISWVVSLRVIFSPLSFLYYLTWTIPIHAPPRMAGLELDCKGMVAMAVADRQEVISDDVSLEKKSEATGGTDDGHIGLVFPSDEELATLRRVSDSIPWTAFCWFSFSFAEVQLT